MNIVDMNKVGAKPLYKSAIVVTLNNVIVSYDLFILDILNNKSLKITEEDKNHYIDLIKAAIVEEVPFYDITISEKNGKYMYQDIESGEYIESDDDKYKFITSRTLKEWFSKSVYTELLKKYPLAIRRTEPVYINTLIASFMEVDTNFILANIDNDVFDETHVILGILGLGFKGMIVDFSEWIKEHTFPDQLKSLELFVYSSNYFIEDYLYESIRDIPKEYLEFVKINTKLITSTIYNLALGALEKDYISKGGQTSFQTAVVDIWDKNLLYRMK